MIIAGNFEEVLHAFDQAGVEFIIAGGYAVIFHGYGRTTGDLDLWVDTSEENKNRIITAFKILKFSPSEISLINSLDFSKPFSFKIGNDPIAIDVFNSITGIKYPEAKEKAVKYTFSNGLSVKFIHLLDLISNKMLTGRPQDLADVEELQKINIHSKNGSIVEAIKKLLRGKK